MFTITMDYWKLGLIVVAVMMLGYLIIQAISWGIDTLLYRKKKIKIEPPKQSKLIIDVPGPSDEVQAKNLKIWVADLDDTVQYLTSELVDVKENFESFKQDVDDTISSMKEKINDVISDIKLRIEKLEGAQYHFENDIGDKHNRIISIEKSIDALEEAAKDEIDNMYRRVRTTEIGIDKLEDRVNAIEHDIGDAFEEIHNNANEIDCVRREGEKEQPILIYSSRNATNGASEVHCGPTTLQNAIDILTNLRNEISNNGFVTMWYLRKLLDCPDEDTRATDQFLKYIKHTSHGWFDLGKAHISLNPGNKKYYVNLPEEVKLYKEDYEVDWSKPAPGRFSVSSEGFMYLGDAAKVLRRMRRNVKDYGFTTVRDFKRAMGNGDIAYSDRYRGWKDLSEAYIERGGADNYFNVIMPVPNILEDEGGD